MLKLLGMMTCLYLTGCIMNVPTISPEVRAMQAAQFAKSVGWKEHTIHTNPFLLKAYSSPIKNKVDDLTIYIEGDGLAWISEDMPSNDPTPIVPTGLEMAIHDQKNYPIAYLARPCQFVLNDDSSACSPEYWTNLRFSVEVINAMNEGVDYLKNYYHAKKIILIGYSGGGTIAALMTARRTDIIKLITVAAILDVKQWVDQKSLTPLKGSLDPADVWEKLVSIKQTHWVGGKDTVVPKEIAFAFANHFPLTKRPTIIVNPFFDHVCCWATDWDPA